LRQQRVGVPFFLEVLLEQTGGLLVSELLGPGDQRAVAGNLVVFDGLSGADDAGVEDGLVLDIGHMLLGLGENALDGLALFAACRAVNELEWDGAAPCTAIRS